MGCAAAPRGAGQRQAMATAAGERTGKQMETHSGADELMCRELVELVTDYLEDALPESERARFEAHLAECDACRAYMSQMRRSVGALSRLATHDLGADERERLLALFRGLRGPAQG